RDDDHLSAVLLLEAQRFFERVGVGLVRLPARVRVANPGLRVVDAQLPLARHDLLDTNRNLHVLERPAFSRLCRAPLCARHRASGLWLLAYSYFFNSNVPFVPPKPNEFESAQRIVI